MTPTRTGPRSTTARPWRWRCSSACARLQGHCHLGLGRLARRRGDGDAAGAALRAAHDLFQELQMTFWLRQLEAVARGR